MLDAAVIGWLIAPSLRAPVAYGALAFLGVMFVTMMTSFSMGLEGNWPVLVGILGGAVAGGLVGGMVHRRGVARRGEEDGEDSSRLA